MSGLWEDIKGNWGNENSKGCGCVMFFFLLIVIGIVLAIIGGCS